VVNTKYYTFGVRETKFKVGLVKQTRIVAHFYGLSKPPLKMQVAWQFVKLVLLSVTRQRKALWFFSNDL